MTCDKSSNSRAACTVARLSNLSSDSKDSEINCSSIFDNCEITAWNISNDNGEDLFADELLVY